METTPASFNLGKRILTLSYLAILIVIPGLFALAPIDQFDSGETVCLSRVFFDLECWGCGMTRALKHLICFDFEGAWGFNKLSFLVLPILTFGWAKEVLRVHSLVRPSSEQTSPLREL